MTNTGAMAVIPFGKHRGRSAVEVAASDPAYLQWLVTQSWFRREHAEICAIVVAVLDRPSDDTPEHNALQALFLEERYRLTVARIAFPWFKIVGASEPRFEVLPVGKPCARTIAGGDVVYCVELAIRPPAARKKRVGVEIKPEVSDDYPAVIRQMRRNRSNLLFLRTYSGEGADAGQFRAIMESSGFRVVFKGEADQAVGR